MVSERLTPSDAYVFLYAERCPPLGGASRFELLVCSSTCEMYNVWVLRFSDPHCRCDLTVFLRRKSGSLDNRVRNVAGGHVFKLKERR